MKSRLTKLLLGISSDGGFVFSSTTGGDVFINNIVNNDGYNGCKYPKDLVHFVAYLHSQMHLLSFKAFYLSQERKGVKLIGRILIKGDGDVYFIKKEELEFLSPSIKIEYVVPKRNNGKIYRIKQIVKNGALDLKYLASDFSKELENEDYNEELLIIQQGPLFLSFSGYKKIKETYPNYKIIFVLLEEGIGLYIRDRKRWFGRGGEKLTGIRKLVRGSKNIIRSWRTNENVIKTLESYGRIKKFYLFDKEGDSLKRNEDVCRAFYHVYEDSKIKLDYQDYYLGKVLINTQPFCEEIGSNADINCLKQVIKMLNSKGIGVVIKPHPREKDLSRYQILDAEIDVSHKGISQETVLANSKSKPIAILGFFSTTLITANVFFDVPAICLGRLLDLKEIGGFSEDINQFIRMFSSVLNVPEDSDDLLEIVIRLSGNIS